MGGFMDNFTQIIVEINKHLWGIYGLIPLLVGAGIYFTIRLNFVQNDVFAQN